MTQPPNPRLSSLFELEYPQSVGIYDSYQRAQAAVDHLADAKFAVQNLAIVGTDLKSVERVTGRRNWGTVLAKGLQSGISTGLMVAFILWFLQPQANFMMLLPGALLIGIVIGVAFAAIGYLTSRGKRDFNSISQTVAARYEVLCEHKLASQAREMLASAPGARAAQFDPRTQPTQWQDQQAPYPQQGGYPTQQGGYPAQQGGYPAQQGGYPAPVQQPGYGYGRPDQPGHPEAPQQGAQPPSSNPAPPPAEERPDAPSFSAGQPYGSYGTADGIGQAPGSQEDGRPPRGD